MEHAHNRRLNGGSHATFRHFLFALPLGVTLDGLELLPARCKHSNQTPFVTVVLVLSDICIQSSFPSCQQSHIGAANELKLKLEIGFRFAKILSARQN